MTSLFSSPRIKAAAAGALALTALGALIPEDAQARRGRGFQTSNGNSFFTIFEFDDTLSDQELDDLVIFNVDQFTDQELEDLRTELLNGGLSLDQILADLVQSPSGSFRGLAGDSGSDGDIAVSSAGNVFDDPDPGEQTLTVNGESISQFFEYTVEFSEGFTFTLYAPDFSSDSIGLSDVENAPIPYLISFLDLLPNENNFIPGELTGTLDSIDFDEKDFGNGTKFGVAGLSAPFNLVEVNDIPEPASIIGLLAVGGLGAGSLVRRKSQHN
ncbi:MAG: PEP-CTERM sorting domain-containing protein [Thainema sp.]